MDAVFMNERDGREGRQDAVLYFGFPPINKFVPIPMNSGHSVVTAHPIRRVSSYFFGGCASKRHPRACRMLNFPDTPSMGRAGRARASG